MRCQRVPLNHDAGKARCRTSRALIPGVTTELELLNPVLMYEYGVRGDVLSNTPHAAGLPRLFHWLVYGARIPRACRVIDKMFAPWTEHRKYCTSPTELTKLNHVH